MNVKEYKLPQISPSCQSIHYVCPFHERPHERRQMFIKWYDDVPFRLLDIDWLNAASEIVDIILLISPSFVESTLLTHIRTASVKAYWSHPFKKTEFCEKSFKWWPSPRPRGGRLTSLDASFGRCFAFWRTLLKTLTSIFFSQTSPKHCIVKVKARCFTWCFRF